MCHVPTTGWLRSTAWVHHVSNIGRLRCAARNLPRVHQWMVQIYGLESATCPTSDSSDMRLEMCHVSTTGWPRSTVWSAPCVQHRTAQIYIQNVPRVQDGMAQIYGLECTTCPTSDGSDIRPGMRHVFTIGGPRSTTCIETRVDNRTT
jgi:hypothetical protein